MKMKMMMMMSKKKTTALNAEQDEQNVMTIGLQANL